MQFSREELAAEEYNILQDGAVPEPGGAGPYAEGPSVGRQQAQPFLAEVKRLFF